MKAVVLTEYGDVDKLEFRDMPDPRAERNGIVIRMAGAGINPIDWKIRSGAAKNRFPVQFPAVLGRDASGEVIEIGEGVTTFTKGDRVMGLVWGAYAEHVAGPVEAWTRTPTGLEIVDAGALPLALLTGAQLSEEALRPSEGDAVLVTGAGGSVGRVAVYAAKSRGARVWAGVRQSQREAALALGVEGVVALDVDGEIAKLPTLNGIADTVGGETIRKLYDKLKPGGVIGSVLGEPGGAKERGFVVRAFTARTDSAMLSKYASAVAAGKLVIPIAKRFPLAQAPEAQRIAENGKLPGKILLVG
jgi:NADPH:quinone reductase-like Zn-dependent oxidoreductase